MNLTNNHRVFKGGLIPTHFNCNCILVLTSLKMATWVVETCLWSLCNQITFIISGTFVSLFKTCLYMYSSLCIYKVISVYSCALLVPLFYVFEYCTDHGSHSDHIVFSIAFKVYGVCAVIDKDRSYLIWIRKEFKYSYIVHALFLGAFPELWKNNINFIMSLYLSVCLRPSVRLPAWNISAPTGRIFMKIYVWEFFENLSRKLYFH